MNWIVFISLLLPSDTGFADVFGKQCKFCWLFNNPVENSTEKEEPKEQVKKKDSYHVYYFTASWCGPCQVIKAGFPSLQEVGWKVGSEICSLAPSGQRCYFAKSLALEIELLGNVGG